MDAIDAILTISGWALIAAGVSWLATRLLVVRYQRKRVDTPVRVVVFATLFTVIGVDLLVFQGDLLKRGKWFSDPKGAYLWYLLPIASLFFFAVAAATSVAALLLSRGHVPPRQ
jgi:branched-subunit amino acid ABC-type transport system permease component